MIKTVDELLNEVKTIVGENTDDAIISFIEDLQDTLKSFERLAIEELQKQIKQVDEDWRKRYRDRFFNDAVGETEPAEETNETEKVKTIDELFK